MSSSKSDRESFVPVKSYIIEQKPNSIGQKPSNFAKAFEVIKGTPKIITSTIASLGALANPQPAKLLNTSAVETIYFNNKERVGSTEFHKVFVAGKLYVVVNHRLPINTMVIDPEAFIFINGNRIDRVENNQRLPLVIQDVHVQCVAEVIEESEVIMPKGEVRKVEKTGHTS